MALIEHIKNFLPIKQLRICRYNRKFECDGYSCFRGVFNSFDEAYASAPKKKNIGFNFPEVADLFLERTSKIQSYDYPMIFWLRSIIEKHQTLFDYGGNIGVHYYAYKEYLKYPEGLTWKVCEVPEVAKAGEKMAREKGVENLKFVMEFDAAEGSDILISAGALQYVEAPMIFESLVKLKRRPQYLLFNKLPLYEGPGFVTLQNAGCSFTAQHVYNKQWFVGEMEKIGYELRDMWDVYGLGCAIPFYPENSFKLYTGLFFHIE
ncbi:MAG: methyltransferase, TIGR04325 family [Desulfatitalea sp.]|nr:methyltransferase, TIGR04325 family [Desulfatitalea sp.]NNK00992.1 methyltransferase, TIGR04325 family [Desulfatitalea sp.]